jgi:hypothetical protein
MKISPDGKTVSFKTEPKELFLAEKSGIKSNTVRILDIDEWLQLKEKDPKKIIIQCQQEIFLRTLSNIHFGGVILGKVIAIFSWRNEEEELDCESTTYASSLDAIELSTDEKFVCVTISRNLHHLLGSIAHGQSMNSIIQEIYEVWCYSRCAKNYSPHPPSTTSADDKTDHEVHIMSPYSPSESAIGDKNIPIIISRETLAILQSIAHGRSMNSVIRQFCEANLAVKRQEEDPLHD